MSSFKVNGSLKVLIAVTGVAVKINPTILANRVDIQALKTNAADIIVGDNTISTDQSAGGIALDKSGQAYNIELVKDMTSIYINGQAGDGVSVNWWTGDRN